jgi:NNP family nitrate/nitrite transporter-like MFS transporter
MLADRFNSRLVFSLLMFLLAVPAMLVPLVRSYFQLLGVAALRGLAGSSFAVGVAFASR